MNFEKKVKGASDLKPRDSSIHCSCLPRSGKGRPRDEQLWMDCHRLGETLYRGIMGHTPGCYETSNIL